MQMCAPNYLALQNSDISWLFDNCGMPNFSSVLFVGSIEETHNSFAILADTSSESDTLEDIDLPDQLGSPIHSSSPRFKPLPQDEGPSVPDNTVHEL